MCRLRCSQYTHVLTGQSTHTGNRRSKIPNYKDGSDEADAIKRTFREIVQDYAKSTSYLASFVTMTPGGCLRICMCVDVSVRELIPGLCVADVSHILAHSEEGSIEGKMCCAFNNYHATHAFTRIAKPIHRVQQYDHRYQTHQAQITHDHTHATLVFTCLPLISHHKTNTSFTHKSICAQSSTT